MNDDPTPAPEAASPASPEPTHAMADEPSIVGAFQVHEAAAAAAAADAAADAAAAHGAAPGAGHASDHAQGDHGHGHGHGHAPGALPGLVLAALGVVFGDIGTSPLYAVKECVTAPHGVKASPENVLGLLSLMFWSLSMVVAVKYLTFVLRADNEGEGGTMALLALVPENLRPKNKTHIGWIAALVLFGASLLYGDGVITPAISVLSAVEGLAVGASSLKPAVLPITVLILLGLFWVQKRGTAGIGKVFGPIMILWFLTLGGLGAYFVAKNPAVLAAVNPAYAVTFFLANKWHAFVILGSVVLCVTGGEALYADMGHFGRKPITYAWYGMVMPSLAFNYFGQGALLLQHPEAAENPFFSLVPKGPATYALVALATAAAVIASQAMISGAYSLTRQGVQLGFLPRVQVKHTSSETEGQIYIPEVNWALFAACMVLVLSFRESSKLASAYGLAVTGSMTITSIVFFVVVRERWHWSLAKALPLLLLFLTFDLAFLGANLLKFFDGGYVPFLIASMIFVCMAIWRKGRALLGQEFKKRTRPLSEVLEELRTGKTAARVDGAAVFLTSSAEEAPPVLLHHVSRSKALQKVVLLVTVIPERIPRVAPEKRVEASLIADDFYRIIFRSGFMEDTNVPVLLAVAKAKLGLRIGPDETTYYLGRETLLATGKGKMDKVSETIFGFLSRNATGATNFFNLPPERVVELGMQLDL
ncbi:KUP/HAK/KT family potassium transporter [Polyangium sp. y55x31]|uniref:potassium transporter Kup n=1 Tax=Polyangium sp. y55x31 TaxID=3042688 RepID=UPI0024828290|nr:KUP/HAK/KT family potassium transporter [Polyangium sp. y55x31]MDI1483269.1 KUP/HAK/KT family potassium transporter [Polyangium sp. y55x31]